MTLFEKLLQASGLSPLFARSSLTRAISRVNASADRLTPEQLKTALPEVEKVLRIFLQGDEITRRLQDIKALTR